LDPVGFTEHAAARPYRAGDMENSATSWIYGLCELGSRSQYHLNRCDIPATRGVEKRCLGGRSHLPCDWVSHDVPTWSTNELSANQRSEQLEPSGKLHDDKGEQGCGKGTSGMAQHARMETRPHRGLTTPTYHPVGLSRVRVRSDGIHVDSK